MYRYCSYLLWHCLVSRCPSCVGGRCAWSCGLVRALKMFRHPPIKARGLCFFLRRNTVGTGDEASDGRDDSQLNLTSVISPAVDNKTVFWPGSFVLFLRFRISWTFYPRKRNHLSLPLAFEPVYLQEGWNLQEWLEPFPSSSASVNFQKKIFVTGPKIMEVFRYFERLYATRTYIENVLH